MIRFRSVAPLLGALAAIALLLSGCAGPAPTPGGTGKSAPPSPTLGAASTSAAPQPKPKPAPVAEANPATIVGSEESSTMLDNLTAYVAAVDGVNVPAGRNGWNHPLRIKAGTRRLTVAFARGRFAAQTEVQLEAKPDAAYEVKFATDAQLFGQNSYCEFWIVDRANNEKVVAPTRSPLAKLDAAAMPH